MINFKSVIQTKMEKTVKNILILLIGLYVLSCSGGSNKSADQHWKDGQQYRTETKLMESITSIKSIIKTYTLHELAAQAQYQIADIYLKDVNNYIFAVKEFEKVAENYSDTDYSKKAIFINSFTTVVNFSTSSVKEFIWPLTSLVGFDSSWVPDNRPKVSPKSVKPSACLKFL